MSSLTAESLFLHRFFRSEWIASYIHLDCPNEELDASLEGINEFFG